MKITDEIDDIYIRYLLYDRDFHELAKFSKKTLPTLKKYVKIKEGLDIFLYPLLGTKEMTMDIALTLCNNVMNPHIQFNVYPSLKGLKTKEKKALIPTFNNCDICAGDSSGMEIMECCGNTLCIECIVSIIEESLNGVCLKEICCPFCRMALPYNYIRDILLMRKRKDQTNSNKYRYVLFYVEPWRETSNYKKIQYKNGIVYLQNLFRKYRHFKGLMSNENQEFTDTHHIGFCNGCVRRYFYDNDNFMRLHLYRKIRNLEFLSIATIEKDCANDMELKKEMFMCSPCKDRDENVIIKSCPHCGLKTIQPDGCNYVKCQCKGFWCFVCNQRLPGTHEGHNVHFYVGPGSGPYSDKCRISEGRVEETHILETCQCIHCRGRNGKSLCSNIDCNRTVFTNGIFCEDCVIVESS